MNEDWNTFMKPWLVRASFAFVLIVSLSLIVKWTLIEPQVTILEFDIGPAMKKGDREI